MIQPLTFAADTDNPATFAAAAVCAIPVLLHAPAKCCGPYILAEHTSAMPACHAPTEPTILHTYTTTNRHESELPAMLQTNRRATNLPGSTRTNCHPTHTQRCSHTAMQCLPATMHHHYHHVPVSPCTWVYTCKQRSYWARYKPSAQPA